MKLVVNKENIRIDKYVASNTDISRSKIETLIKENLILVNGENVKPSYKVSLKDVITVFYEEEVIEILPENIKLDIIYEDEYILVVNKPSGMVTHPGSGVFKNTLVNALLFYTKELSDIGGEERPGIVHRLDKDTSGLLIVAKNNEVHKILSKDFKKHKINREYKVLVEGIVPSSKGKIDVPISRSNKDFRLMEASKDGKESITYFEVLKRYKEHTLLKINLKTGRTHQIRVHLSYIGHPVYNDPVYGKYKEDSFNQYLHAYKLSLVHPISKEVMTFEIKLPKEFDDKLKSLELY